MASLQGFLVEFMTTLLLVLVVLATAVDGKNGLKQVQPG
jgi:glycerol uptake facilitator-like aquaporin